MLANIGLALIITGWAVQLAALWKKKREISQWFVIIYSVGVILLVADGFSNGLTSLALLNFICIIPAALVLIEIRKAGK